MSELTRFDLVVNGDRTMLPHPDGPYVLYSDAQARVEALEEFRKSVALACSDAIDLVRCTICGSVAVGTTIHHEVTCIVGKIEAASAAQEGEATDA